MEWIIIGIAVFWIVSLIVCVCFGHAAALGELSEDDLCEADKCLACQHSENVCGKGANLWADDDDFETFLQATKGKETDDAKS